MTDPLAALPDLLAEATRPGDYYTTGEISAPLPLIEVDGVGPLAFPVLDHQARQLLAIAEPAPYGRGDQTLVDPAVRRAGQIAPARITIDEAVWSPVLDRITYRLERGLGAPGPIEAELYKLLVYGPGDFFVEHRDTEKAPGMFATLVVLLPARWSGGALVVRHAQREATLDIGGLAPSTIGYAAFYADCLHELRPITDGYRVALVYNICRTAPDMLTPPDHGPLVNAVTARLRAWVTEGYPIKALLPLEHKYTPAALSFDGLKGRDRAVVQIVHAAAERADCAIHLAIVSLEESGDAELTYAPPRWQRLRTISDCDFEVIEAYDFARSVTHWRGLDDTPVELGQLPFEEDELFPPDALEGEAPDEESFHEATGNTGATYERTYRRAVIALWTRSSFVQVWASAEPSEAVETLVGLTRAGDPRAADFALALIDRWPPADGLRPARPDTALITALAALGARSVAEAFARRRLSDFPVKEGMAAPLTSLLATCSAKVIRDVVVPAAVVRTPLDGTPWPIMLAGLLEAGALDVEGAAALAEAIVTHLPTAQRQGYTRSPVIAPALIAGLVRALSDFDDPRLTIRAMGHIEAHGDVYDLDTVLTPAALLLADVLDEQRRRHLAFMSLRDMCLDHLDARIAAPLVEPDTWCQAADLQCACSLCGEFATFLAADEQVWTCKVAKAGRRHLYARVSARALDVDARTIRVGSPFTWQATKNRASFEARTEQREHDLAHRDRLLATRTAAS